MKQSIVACIVLCAVACGNAVRDRVETKIEIRLGSAEESAALYGELRAMGFGGGGHSDGARKDGQGVVYAMAGYHLLGEHDGTRFETDFITLQPPQGSGLLTNYLLAVRCFSTDRENAEAKALSLHREVERRVKDRAGKTKNPPTP